MTVATNETGAGNKAASGSLQAVARPRKRAAFVGGVLALLLLSLVTRYILSSRPASGDRFCTKVIDGDTIKLDDGERVRLIGVDTPEKDDRRPEMRQLAAAATDFTRRLCERRSVRLEYDFERQDRHGRTLAYVFLKGRHLRQRRDRAAGLRLRLYPIPLPLPGGVPHLRARGARPPGGGFGLAIRLPSAVSVPVRSTVETPLRPC